MWKQHSDVILLISCRAGDSFRLCSFCLQLSDQLLSSAWITESSSGGPDQLICLYRTRIWAVNKHWMVFSSQASIKLLSLILCTSLARETIEHLERRWRGCRAVRLIWIRCPALKGLSALQSAVFKSFRFVGTGLAKDFQLWSDFWKDFSTDLAESKNHALLVTQNLCRSLMEYYHSSYKQAIKDYKRQAQASELSVIKIAVSKIQTQPCFLLISVGNQALAIAPQALSFADQV